MLAVEPIVVILTAVGLVISLSALTLTAVGLRKKTSDDRTDYLEMRLESAEKTIVKQQKELDECRSARTELRDQNFDLLMENRKLRGQ